MRIIGYKYQCRIVRGNKKDEDYRVIQPIRQISMQNCQKLYTVKKTAGRIPQRKGVRCYSPLAMCCKKWILPVSIRDYIPVCYGISKKGPTIKSFLIFTLVSKFNFGKKKSLYHKGRIP